MEIFGYIAGICTALCFLPQTIKTLRTKDVRGLSLISYVVYAVGMLCWIIYGCHLYAWPMIIFNTPAFIFALLIIAQILQSKEKK